MNSPIKVSVLICTHNRAGTLAATIDSVLCQTLPDSHPWEIVIIDNNSSDGTRQLVEDFQRRHPHRIRYVFEGLQGISYARNAAVREARGEIIAFIDDDETAVQNWLNDLTAHLHNGEWAGAAGRILQPDGFSLPVWLKSSLAKGPLVSFDLGAVPQELKEAPFSANMAFRKEVFERYGLFRIDLGRSGTNLISNEDTEFGRRVLAAGLKLRYVPSALTYHPVEERRLQKNYVLNWWFYKGRSDVRELGNPPGAGQLFGIPLRLFRAVGWAAVRWMASFSPSKRFSYKVETWNCVGQLAESYHQARRKGLNNQ